MLELVDAEAITSQEQLRERSAAQGIEATQATLSRDIRDLGLVKSGGRRGLPAAGSAGEPPIDRRRRAPDAPWTTTSGGIEAVEQLVVLKTDAGQAQPLAEAIDRAGLPDSSARLPATTRSS